MPSDGWLETRRRSAMRRVLTGIAGLLAIAMPGDLTAQPQAPTPPTPVVIDIEGSPSLGPPDAPVTIVEFGDFQCPFCAQGARALRELQATQPGRIRWVFKHFPIGRTHPDAPLAHEAAIAAQEQGKFWEMHERLFQTRRLAYDDLLA